MSDIREFDAEVISFSRGTLSLSVDLGFRVWKVLQFRWDSGNWRPRDFVHVEVSMEKVSRTHHHYHLEGIYLVRSSSISL